tara:strand:+ start:323 stop:535 length:213 start_codon:yes stop_codon:yes gene_type:complete
MSKGLGIQLAKARKEIARMKKREAGLLKSIMVISDSVGVVENEHLFDWIISNARTFTEKDYTEEMKEWMI